MVSLGLTILFALPLLAAPYMYKGHKWMPPGPTDRRSPCPAVNTLANHGIIYRNGTDVPLNEIGVALVQYYGDVAGVITEQFTGRNIFLQVIENGLTKTRSDGEVTLSLDALFKHDRPIEQDASHSRHDEAFGFRRSYKQDCGLLDQLFSANQTSDVLTLDDILQNHRARILDSRCYNPNFSNFSVPNREERIIATASQDLLMLVFGSDPDMGFVSKARLHDFFALERFPKDYVPLHLGQFDSVTATVDRIGSIADAVIRTAINEEVNCDEVPPTVICKESGDGTQKCKRVKKGKQYKVGRKKGSCKLRK